MNRNDEQFDEFLRSKFKQQPFEMKDQYWMNAQEMIATHRATAGQGMLNMVLSGIVLVALSAGLLWNSANTPSAAKQEQSAFLASPLPQQMPEVNTPIEALSASTPSGSQANTTPANSNVSPTTPETQQTPLHNTASGLPKKKRFIQQQRTRKAALAALNNTTPPLPAEQVTPNTATDITYINGRLFRPVRTAQNGLAPTPQTPDFLAYEINRSKGFLTVEGGVNSYNQAASSLNFHAGIRYYRFLSPKVAVSTGLTYARLQQQLDARVFRSVDYSFGQNTNETRITTLRLDYLEIPLSAYYAVAGNHYIQAGATVGYAIQSSDLVESNGNKGQSENGYMDGIQKWDVQLNAGYACLIQNRYTFSAGYYIGLMDVSKNTSFNTAKTDRNSGIRLTIGYKLF